MQDVLDTDVLNKMINVYAQDPSFEPAFDEYRIAVDAILKENPHYQRAMSALELLAKLHNSNQTNELEAILEFKRETELIELQKLIINNPEHPLTSLYESLKDCKDSTNYEIEKK